MIKIFCIISFSLAILGCSNDVATEYFCESTRLGDNDSSTLYFQASVKLSNDGICIFHRGSEFCAIYEQMTKGFVDKSDWDKNLIHSENYYSSVDGDNYIFKVYDKYELRYDAIVDAKLIGDNWNFSFKDKKLIPALPNKFANDESMTIYKVAAIENFEYSWAKGDFVTKKTEALIKKNADNNSVEYFFQQKEQVVFDYDSEKYSEIKSYLNGTHFNNVYKFNLSDLSLENRYIKPILGDDGVYRYQCQIWNKQKWYNIL